MADAHMTGGPWTLAQWEHLLKLLQDLTQAKPHDTEAEQRPVIINILRQSKFIDSILGGDLSKFTRETLKPLDTLEDTYDTAKVNWNAETKNKYRPCMALWVTFTQSKSLNVARRQGT